MTNNDEPNSLDEAYGTNNAAIEWLYDRLFSDGVFDEEEQKVWFEIIQQQLSTRANNTPDNGAIEALDWIHANLRPFHGYTTVHTGSFNIIRQALSKPSVDVDHDAKLALTYIHGVAIEDNDDLLTEAAEKLESALKQGHITDKN